MLSKRDNELIAAATQAIRRRYKYDWQEVGAALSRQKKPAGSACGEARFASPPEGGAPAGWGRAGGGEGDPASPWCPPRGLPGSRGKRRGPSNPGFFSGGGGPRREPLDHVL